jgi:preprotein translocase subunit SecD
MKTLALLAVLVTSTPAMAGPALVFSFIFEKIEFGPGDIVDAAAVLDDQGKEPMVIFRMTQAKAAEFGRLTSRYIGNPMDILVCGALISSPVIREPIRGGSGQISGGFDMEEARIIAEQLRTGACPGV